MNPDESGFISPSMYFCDKKKPLPTAKVLASKAPLSKRRPAKAPAAKVDAKTKVGRPCRRIGSKLPEETVSNGSDLASSADEYDDAKTECEEPPPKRKRNSACLPHKPSLVSATESVAALMVPSGQTTTKTPTDTTADLMASLMNAITAATTASTAAADAANNAAGMRRFAPRFCSAIIPLLFRISFTTVILAPRPLPIPLDAFSALLLVINNAKSQAARAAETGG